MSEVDPIIKVSLKLMHSNASDSAEKLRFALDDLIKQRFGHSKTLSNTLNKKFLSEEATFPRTIKQADRIGSPIPEETISIHSEEENLTEFNDLECVLCGAMVLTAGNRLVECNTCQKLYHQECHKPNITDSDANGEDWCCSTCSKVVPVEANFPISTPSSASSSPYHRTHDSSPTQNKSGKSKTNKDIPTSSTRSKASDSPSFSTNAEKVHKKKTKVKK